MRELKDALAKCGVDHTGSSEKSDLVHLARVHVLTLPAPAAEPSVRSCKLTHSYISSAFTHPYMCFMCWCPRLLLCICERARANSKEVEAGPSIFLLRARAQGGSDNQCCICLGEYEEGDQVILMTTDHT